MIGGYNSCYTYDVCKWNSTKQTGKYNKTEKITGNASEMKSKPTTGENERVRYKNFHMCVENRVDLQLAATILAHALEQTSPLLHVVKQTSSVLPLGSNMF